MKTITQLSAFAFRPSGSFADDRLSYIALPPRWNESASRGRGDGNEQEAPQEMAPMRSAWTAREATIHFAAELLLFAVATGCAAWAIAEAVGELRVMVI